VLARKPLSEKTVAENVLKWGTGGLNIDGCRIPTEDNLNGGRYSDNKGEITCNVYTPAINKRSKSDYNQPTGRFPANVILDEEAGKLLDEQSGISKSTGGSGEKSRGALGKNVYGKYSLNIKASNAGGLGDSGGASRFFYCAKASKKERGEGNNHPTVKPVKLIEYLITLITPPNGTVLDPFLGSGTTAIAALNTGRYFIGIEKEKKYFDIANERIANHTIRQRLKFA
jgi:site-specific DNA-methyltransferase (adenine-specific)